MATTGNQPMFELDQAVKAYPGATTIGPATLTILRGERIALMGPSGSGKTTLLNLLAAVLKPDEGRLAIAGRPSQGLQSGPELARLVGIMPQSLDLVLSLPVVHNVLAGRLGEWGLVRSLISLLYPRDLDQARAALARVGIPGKLYERTSRLSGGEQQRVALARLLVQHPEAILVDEPVASVDPARAADLIQLLVSLATENGQTLVASLHSVPLALCHFSRVIALRQGRIAFDRPVEEVTTDDLSALYVLEPV